MIVMCAINSKRRNIYNFSVKFVNVVNAPAHEEVFITNFYDFLIYIYITTLKQYDDHQLIFDNSSKIVALSKPFNNKNIVDIKMTLQVLNDQTWNLYIYERLTEYSSIVSSLPSVLTKSNVEYFFDTINKTNFSMETKTSMI